MQVAQQTKQEQQEQIDYITQLGVVPLITLHSTQEAIPLAEALAEGGLPIAEVTFRSPYALEGMKLIKEYVSKVTLLAGTVLSIDQAKAALDAGCAGLVTPSFNPELVDWAIDNDVLIVPGTATPSDVEQAYDRGLRHVKFFPAEAYGGVATLKSLHGPFADMKFLPTGGISLTNAPLYLALNNVFAIGGSFPVPASAQQDGDWDVIVRNCSKARELVQAIRG
ncbi:bifunctional 4-hydroxy-2-oxoglutarate aldolase/2-dehydro-3-deoxy-phosphogluconate aldolase [Bifidobacterium canis]|uniref:2-dehydro-3-deoxy-phosphogluconate aldolase n=1 Tax=Bifidobacterium canis TaxID=2610880 RepID=A0A7K1J2N0_9BIFI|nr:bifunctional 4-hydroxy-2-oxoglutarate aldolase/2-dehydro-3-deoxy-phosphogluconate aldolase [Bifidobacterium canis]MUH58898.1 2-dehydro-3-deoxy-phosphogluconate aldolase [Bifidobacterium canis]